MMEIDGDNTREQALFSRRKKAEIGFSSVGLSRCLPESGSTLLLGLPRSNVTRARLRAIDAFFQQPEGSTKKERISLHRTQSPLFRIVLSVATVTEEVLTACSDRFFCLKERNSPISVEFCGKQFSKPLPIDVLNCPADILAPPTLLLMLHKSGFIPRTVETWPNVSLARIHFYEQRQADYFIAQLETAPTLGEFRSILRGDTKISHHADSVEFTRFHLTPSMSFEELWTTFSSRPDLMIFDYYRPAAERDRERFCFFSLTGNWKPETGLFGPLRVLSVAGTRDSTTNHELSAHQSQIRTLQVKVEELTRQMAEKGAHTSSDEIAAMIDHRIAASVPKLVEDTVHDQLQTDILPIIEARNREVVLKLDDVVTRLTKKLEDIVAKAVVPVAVTPPRPQKKSKNQPESSRQLTLSLSGTAQRDV